MSPIGAREMLFPSQPGTPSPDIREQSYRSVTPPPKRKELNIQENRQSPERSFTRYGAITPPPGQAFRHTKRDIYNYGSFGRKKTSKNALKQKFIQAKQPDEKPVSFALKTKY